MNILIGVPTYDGKISMHLANALYHAIDDTGRANVMVKHESSSLLARTFNALWCEALNDKRFDAFVMLHADVAPMHTLWLRKLIQVQEQTHADIIGSIIPLKNDEGKTSTAVASWQHPTERRVTMREAYQLPETFGIEDVLKLWGEVDDNARLLVNTGLMYVDMRKRAILETMFFTIRDQIIKDPSGKFYPHSLSEDWDFSMQANVNGLKVMATRCVPLIHIGNKNYGNESAWGTLEHDNGDNPTS